MSKRSAKASKARRRRIRAGTIIIPLLFISAIVSGALGGYVLATTKELPGVTELETYRPSVITKVFADDGSVVGEFAIERRILVPFEDISPNFTDAIIAVEDSQFYHHSGVNVLAIARAAYKNFQAGGVVEGGSTITQQLAKLLFLTPEKSLERKINEAILATQIERHYTKEQILEFYSNKIYLGHGVYGIEAGAQFYFDKSASELTVLEAATLAAIPKSPPNYTPDDNPDRALKRRNIVLRRMGEVGFITPAESSRLQAMPIALKRGLEKNNVGPYFVEEVRQYIEKNYGAERLYEAGLRVYTTMDPRLQQIAERAVRRGIHAQDRWDGWRGEVEKAFPDPDAITPEALDGYEHPDWDRHLVSGDFSHALVTQVTADRAVVRLGPYRAEIDKSNSDWIWRKLGSYDMTKALSVGDLPVVGIERLGDDPLPDEEGDDKAKKKKDLPNLAPNEALVTLQQQPVVQGALVALEVGTGQVKAMVGGYEFEQSKFDRATQALRQLGSAFKPVVYTAAMDNGFRQTDVLLDAPLRLIDKVTGEVYSPRNYDGTYAGPTPIWRALALSRNVPAVRMLLELGPETVIDYARMLGITSPMQPYPSLALGAAEVTPIQIATAYSTFPNQGVLVEPTLLNRIVDIDGNVVEEHRAKAQPVIRADTAMVMTDMLSGVVDYGTGRKARNIAPALAGKTGTTNDYTDTWFVGFSPNIVVAVWVGHDEKVSLGRRRTGSAVALPVWMEFMEAYVADHPAESWNEPGSVTRVKIDKVTGLRAGPDCSNANVRSLIFQRGTEPEQVCSLAQHIRHEQGEQMVYDGNNPATASGDWEFPENLPQEDEDDFGLPDAPLDVVP